MPKYPNVHVELIGQDGNAFAILAATRRALRRAGVSQTEIDHYHTEATAHDYDHLLQVTMNWVEIR